MAEALPAWVLWLLMAWLPVSAVLMLWLLHLVRTAGRPGRGSDTGTAGTQQLHTALQTSHAQLAQELHRSLLLHSGNHAQALQSAASETNRQQLAGQEAFARQLHGMQQHLHDSLHAMTEQQHQQMAALQQQVRTQMQSLQNSSEEKLEQMRLTVNEKLHSTLRSRLDESFQQVAQRLEQVHRGLGEMHTLAQGVGDLKHLLSNVRTRGIYGEIQLQRLLEEVFTPGQYLLQAQVKPGSREAVDCAVKLPGRGGAGAAADTVLLPVDAKFPHAPYERLLAARQAGDVQQQRAAEKALEQALLTEAKSIAAKYICPPHTTDFAILFLPTESLYAEALRLPELFSRMQRDCHVTLAGPTTLLALLNALQMGFRTLALERRTSEAWQILATVKAEFNRFGTVLERVKKQTQTVLNTLDQAQTRTSVMHRALREVDAPEPTAESLSAQASGQKAGQDSGYADGIGTQHTAGAQHTDISRFTTELP